MEVKTEIAAIDLGFMNRNLQGLALNFDSSMGKDCGVHFGFWRPHRQLTRATPWIERIGVFVAYDPVLPSVDRNLTWGVFRERL